MIPQAYPTLKLINQGFGTEDLDTLVREAWKSYPSKDCCVEIELKAWISGSNVYLVSPLESSLIQQFIQLLGLLKMFTLTYGSLQEHRHLDVGDIFFVYT